MSESVRVSSNLCIGRKNKYKRLLSRMSLIFDHCVVCFHVFGPTAVWEMGMRDFWVCVRACSSSSYDRRDLLTTDTKENVLIRFCANRGEMLLATMCILWESNAFFQEKSQWHNSQLLNFCNSSGGGGFGFGLNHRDKNRTDSCDCSSVDMTSESLAWSQPGMVLLTRRFCFLHIISQIHSFLETMSFHF